MAATVAGWRQMTMALSMAAGPLAASLSIASRGGNCSGSLYKSNILFFPCPSPASTKRGSLTIRCFRVGGVEIPNGKRVELSLQYIHGIGRTRARQIFCDLSLQNKVTKDLSVKELIDLRDEVSKYMIEGDLKRFNRLAIERLKVIGCYRGIRHEMGLPCRGQRTKNNCRTLKGKGVTVTGKKKSIR